jgi:hypothetical protein
VDVVAKGKAFALVGNETQAIQIVVLGSLFTELSDI